MVKLLKQSSISLHFGSLRVNGWTTKAQTFKQNIKSLTERKDNIFLKPNDRTYASGWMTVWRLDTEELKRFGKTLPVKMVETTVQLGGDITKESDEMQIEALENYEEATKKCMAKEYHFRSDDPT